MALSTLTRLMWIAPVMAGLAAAGLSPCAVACRCGCRDAPARQADPQGGCPHCRAEAALACEECGPQCCCVRGAPSSTDLAVPHQPERTHLDKAAPAGAAAAGRCIAGGTSDTPAHVLLALASCSPLPTLRSQGVCLQI